MSQHRNNFTTYNKYQNKDSYENVQPKRKIVEVIENVTQFKIPM